MPVPATIPMDSVEEVTERRRRLDQVAPRIESDIEDAVETLVDLGALPRDHWRFLAHVLFCRAIYASYVRDLESHLTLSEIANHLNERDVTRFRGQNEWTPGAVSDLREVVAYPGNQILLPDP